MKITLQKGVSFCLSFTKLNLMHKMMMCMLLLIASVTVQAQSDVTVKGVVKDTVGGLPGVSVKVSGTLRGVSTGEDGGYTVTLPRSGKLLFSMMGYKPKTVAVADYTPNSAGVYVINIQLASDENALDEVAVVGFGTQKKASMISSITTISPKELKGPTSNLTTMLAGRVAGMIAYQRSGEPGLDNAQFFIRGLGTFGAGKQDPLILIDGAESTQNDMARLQPNDIAAFSVLKDASASAVYGARGANGVVLITTKTGEVGATKFLLTAENSLSANTQNFEFADNVTYMKMANEAVLTRNRLAVLPYLQSKIDATAAGENELLYPNNNWIDQLIKDYTINSRYNLNVSGGGTKARFFVSGTYNIDNGVLKSAELNNFNSNIKLKNYSIRSNVDIELTKTTLAAIKVFGQFDDYTGPVGGGAATFNRAIWSNPVMFPAIYPASLSRFSQHPLFGNAVSPTGALYMNPYAEMVKGYQDRNSSTLQTQIELKQDLNFLTKGLNARLMSYVRRYSSFDISRAYNPFYYSATQQPDQSIGLSLLNGGGAISVGPVGAEYLGYAEGTKNLNSIFYAELSATYDRTFGGKHAVGGMLITTMRNYLAANPGSLQLSLPARNQGVSGRATYAYDTRYMVEFNFGYNGSERFAANNRFGFFPTIGFGYNVSNEKFFQPLTKVISSLKLRGTYGLAGNDQIGRPEDRFFYMSEVNMNDGNYGATFGENSGYTRSGVLLSRYSNPLITWEESKQINLGVDMTLFNALNLTFEVYKNERSNILTARTYIPSSMGLQAAVQANTNKMESKGIDFAGSYNKAFSNGITAQLRGNMTYATNKVLIYDEPTFNANESYRYHVGLSGAQTFGYVAERLFVDDNEAKNSPLQFAGVPGITYGGGDIKYRDINGDGIISDVDMVPIGLPTTPEIIYGFGGTIGYKGFEASAFFQGSARSSFFINPSNITPFALNTETGNPNATQNGLLKVISDSYWSEQNRNSYAFWPRLGPSFVDNNTRTSTWWMRNGDFLRLKSVELAYNFPQPMLKKISVNGLRVFVNATNLNVISSFKLWDPEMGGNGLGYPLQSVYNLGLNVNF